MGSKKEFVDYVMDQISFDGLLHYRQMFGEYAIYADGKIFGLICDDKCFIKPTPGGRAFIGNPVEAPAYPGAKMSFLIEDELEDREWMSQLVRITVAELPEPRPKKKKKK